MGGVLSRGGDIIRCKGRGHRRGRVQRLVKRKKCPKAICSYLWETGTRRILMLWWIVRSCCCCCCCVLTAATSTSAVVGVCVGAAVRHRHLLLLCQLHIISIIARVLGTTRTLVILHLGRHNASCSCLYADATRRAFIFCMAKQGKMLVLVPLAGVRPQVRTYDAVSRLDSSHCVATSIQVSLWMILVHYWRAIIVARVVTSGYFNWTVLL